MGEEEAKEEELLPLNLVERISKWSQENIWSLGLLLPQIISFLISLDRTSNNSYH